jgi:predicted PurR-regulated permease PerM
MHRPPPVPPIGLLALLAAVLYFALRIHDVLIPFVLSFALAYLLNPVINYFEARGLRRDLIVLALYLLIIIIITSSANFLLPAMSSELAGLQAKAPQYFSKAQEFFGHLQVAIADHLPFGQSTVQQLSFKMYDPLIKQLPKIPSYVLSLFPLFSLLFLVPFITFFILMDSKSLMQSAIQLCPSRYVEQVLHVTSEIDTSLGNYIRGLLTIALAIGSVSYIGLKILHIDYALAIATLSGIASFIPYLGALLGMAVGATVAFFQYVNLTAPLEVIVLFVGIRLADEAFVQPLVSKHAVHLHPLIFLLALMVGGKIFGFIGLLFAVPAACVIKALIMVAWDWYVTEAQISVRPHLPEATAPYT